MFDPLTQDDQKNTFIPPELIPGIARKALERPIDNSKFEAIFRAACHHKIVQPKDFERPTYLKLKDGKGLRPDECREVLKIIASATPVL